VSDGSRKRRKTPDRNRVACSAADVEPDTGNALSGAKELAAFTAPVCITFHCSRKRLADVDNLSGKACIDGIVEAGLLTDDSTKQVAEVRYRQTKSRTETTKIVIEEI
jgi:Holliday junction resolvase RusA-like endonuclease